MSHMADNVATLLPPPLQPHYTQGRGCVGAFRDVRVSIFVWTSVASDAVHLCIFIHLVVYLLMT